MRESETPSGFVWDTRYRLHRPDGTAESDIDQTWTRVAQALAGVEAERATWAERFLEILRGLRFLPGGRSQTRMNDTGPDAAPPVSRAGVPRGRSVEKS